jgi:hypothetical protein
MTEPVMIEKNGRECYRVAWSEYEGHRYVDLRLHYRDGEEWKPSRKGIAIKPDALASVISALQSMGGGQ